MKLIGKSGQIQTIIQFKVNELLASLRGGESVPIKKRRWLFTGPPGCGKSHLAKQTSLNLAGDSRDYDTEEQLRDALQRNASVEHRNGTNVSIDLVRDWYRNGCYKPMFGDVTVKFIDEVDAVGAAALNDIRTFLDELSSHTVVIAATNLPVEKLQPQLQSRFQVFYFERVTTDAITAHLLKLFGEHTRPRVFRCAPSRIGPRIHHPPQRPRAHRRAGGFA